MEAENGDESIQENVTLAMDVTLEEEVVEETVEEETVNSADESNHANVEEELVEETVHEEVVEETVEDNDDIVTTDDIVTNEEIVHEEEVVHEEDIQEETQNDQEVGPLTNDAPNNEITLSPTPAAVNSDSDSDDEDDRPRQNLNDQQSDSDSEDEKPKETIASDDEEPSGPTGLESSDDEVQTKKARIDSDSDDDDEEDNEAERKKIFGDDSGSEPEGESTAEPREREAEKGEGAIVSSDDERPMDNYPSQVSDFDIMMQKRKEEARQKRMKGKKSDSCFIGDADDSINSMLNRMKEAADSDKASNIKRQPALKKLSMLKEVVKNISKHDLNEMLVENGVMSAIADWISPLPDKSLPSLNIRIELLKVLRIYTNVSAETLKHSGIGKAVMLLYKHPKEVRVNKDLCRELISRWSRPIYGLNDNYQSMTREAREARDFELLPKAKKRRLKEQADGRAEKQQSEDIAQPKPGRKGFVMRARVPMPSNQDYVVRPKWNVDGADSDDEAEAEQSSRKRREKAPRNQVKKKSAAEERLDRQLKRQLDMKRDKRVQKGATVNLQKITL